MKRKIIEFKDYSFQYRVQAEPTLKNINLTIYEGEKVLIVGPSGSGKSTLAHCLNGLVPFYYNGKSYGDLIIDGENVKEKNIFELSKVIGTVLQDPDSQFIGLTVGEDIAFKLENECVEQNEMKRIVNESSKLVNIDKELETSPYKLSGGQKQRVTLAGVTVDDVKILLFDEPLASLDPLTGKSAIKLIDSIKRRNNKTMIIVEHRLEDVLYKNIDRIIVMENGEIIADTTPNEILSTNILKNTGIREPLYISALKYAGCNITPQMKPESIDSIQLNDCKEKLNTWYSNIEENEVITNEDYILEINDLSFKYGEDKKILNNVSFKVKKGDIVSIVGKNGAGKSTISKLICGFYKQTSGQIIFEGNNITHKTIKERAEKIGFVMQNPNQMICKSMIYDEVAFGLRIRGYSEDVVKEKVYNVLKVCGLYQFRNWPISALSFGQKKRVTIAAILILEPKVIILDEPTAGQDFKHYSEIMEFLVELNKQGITIIMITHDMHLMLEYTNNVIVLSDGQKIAEDTAINILTNEFVIEKANLKETSLYELAQQCGIKDEKSFIKRFIDYDRRVR